ncbi:hypothetical protein [Corynebacterium nuruki]|uniref:hypothetical protein n=1 Tax=Corynebacterium nuruki TaxID=1032851 RepID=UPI0023560FA6
MTEQNTPESAPDPEREPTPVSELPDINVSPDGDITDHRRPLLRAARLGGIGIAVLTVISLAVWGGSRELPGIWGVLIGAAIGGGFVLATVGIVLLTSNTTPQTTMIVVLGSWLLKFIVVLVILLLIKDMDFYDHTAMAVTVILALVVGLATESVGVLRTTTTYVG